METPAPHRLTHARVSAAERVIDPVFLRTPQYACEALSVELGIEVALKIETLNPIRCFKGRGADYLVAEHASGVPIVTASAGNFGQAMAYACRKRHIDLTVYAATSANPLKLQRMRALGANVVLAGDDFDAAKEAARERATASGERFVEDGKDIETLAGAGTIALEWLRGDQAFDTLAIPLGNGALINGIARVVKASRPAVRIVAVQAAGAPAMVESWRAGRLVTHDRVHTIADGIGVRIPVPEAVEDMRGFIDDAVLVPEEALIDAMRLIHRHVGILAEPSAAAGVAALLTARAAFAGRRVGTVLCGSNMTDEQRVQWLGKG
ncbi:MAG: pyridoxal-phosphate dependent enzyme [Rhodothermales bacterium]